jgi:hypothetical protein
MISWSFFLKNWNLKLKMKKKDSFSFSFFSLWFVIIPYNLYVKKKKKKRFFFNKKIKAYYYYYMCVCVSTEFHLHIMKYNLQIDQFCSFYIFCWYARIYCIWLNEYLQMIILILLFWLVALSLFFLILSSTNWSVILKNSPTLISIEHYDKNNIMRKYSK